MNHRRLFVSCAVLVGAVGTSKWTPALAESIPLVAEQIRLERLGPDQLASSVNILVDQTSRINIDIICPLDGLITRIAAADGQILDANSTAGLGGLFLVIPPSPSEAEILVSGTNPLGFTYHYEFPSRGPGTYRVEFQTAAAVTHVPVVVHAMFDSSIQSSLLVTDSEWIVGEQAVVCVPVLNAGQPVGGANVTVTLLPPVGETSTVVLADDGVDPDGQAGDGVYSAFYTPESPGTYSLAGKAEGPGFERSSAAVVQAIARAARFVDGTISGAGQDDNFDGAFERWVLSANIDVLIPGMFAFVCQLHTPNNQEFTVAGHAELALGMRSISAAIQAQTIRSFNENGPYTITLAQLLYLSPEGPVPADRLEGPLSTGAFDLSVIERPDLVLTGVNSDAVSDTDADGDADKLTVRAGVISRLAGRYSYSVALFNACSEEIEFVSGDQDLLGQDAPQELVFVFNGSAIGRNAINGPYRVQDLTIVGPASLVAVEVAGTMAYSADAFDSFAPRTDPPEVRPGLFQSPLSAMLCSGESAELTVTAVGDFLTFEWLRNGEVIPSASGPSFVATEPGEYKVNVRNPCGMITSDAATLTVHSLPTITLQPIAGGQCPGGTAQLSVGFNDGGSPATLQWRKNSVPIDGATSADLALPSITEADAATFDVVISNACGSVTSTPAALTVQRAPSITVQPQAGAFSAGQQATLAVEVTGSEPLSFQWRKDGNPVAGATAPKLEIASFQDADKGSYDVVITNACGSVSSNAVGISLSETPVTPITPNPTDQSGQDRPATPCCGPVMMAVLLLVLVAARFTQRRARPR